MLTMSDLTRLYLASLDAAESLVEDGFASLWRCLLVVQAEELKRAVGVRVRFVRGQPFEGDDAAERMCDQIAATGDLPVGVDFNESILNGKEGNILFFRVAHELSHYMCDREWATQGRRCNFAIEGETRTMHRQASHLLVIADRLNFAGYGDHERCRIVQAMFSEVVLQVAAFYTLGDYAPQKVALLPLATINTWLAQHDLSPLLTPPAQQTPVYH